MTPCNKCSNNNWETTLSGNTIYALCRDCGFETTLEAKDRVIAPIFIQPPLLNI